MEALELAYGMGLLMWDRVPEPVYHSSPQYAGPEGSYLPAIGAVCYL